MGDRGQSLYISPEDPFKCPGLGFAQLRELGSDVRHRAVVLTNLHARPSNWGVFSTGSEPLDAQCVREGRHSVKGAVASDLGIHRVGQGRSAVLGEGNDGLLAPGLAEIAQGGGGQVVVGVRESGAPGVGQRVGASWSSAPTVEQAPTLDLDEQPVSDQTVKVTTNAGGGQTQSLGQHGGGLWSLLQDEPGDRVAGATLGCLSYFHNTSMTYFPGQVFQGGR
jgi:hypothetical protein